MIKFVTHYVKLIFIFLIDLYSRVSKFIKFLWFEKHEVERICESQTDIYDKTMQVDRWLSKTRCKKIKSFLQKHFEKDSKASSPKKVINRILLEFRCNKSIDEYVEEYRSYYGMSYHFYFENLDCHLNEQCLISSGDLLEVINEEKCLSRKYAPHCMGLLDGILFRFVSYKLTLMLAEELASIKYDATFETHRAKLIDLWNNLVKADEQLIDLDSTSSDASTRVFPPHLSKKITDESDIVSKRWSHIGFQGEDPGTDFRGMGLLGLIQLEYLSRKSNSRLARDLLKSSLDEEHSYPFAITGINITYNLLKLFQDGFMKHLYYDDYATLFRGGQATTLRIIQALNELYVELFLRFDCFWHEAKPSSIFDFKPLMEEFVTVIKMDLVDRNFSFKFIYQ